MNRHLRRARDRTLDVAQGPVSGQRGEGFFGRLKNEFFYGRDWSDVTQDEFMARLDEWLRLYSTERIKYFKEDGKTVYDTIDGRRRRLGLAA